MSRSRRLIPSRCIRNDRKLLPRGKGWGIWGNMHSGSGCENDTRSFWWLFRLAWVLNWGKVAKYVRRVHNHPLTGIV